MNILWARVLSILAAGAVCACGGNFEAGDQTGGAGGQSGNGGSGASGGSSGSGGNGSGGVAGFGGGGTAGTGGSGGFSPCIAGGACASEGSTCSEERCCPCLYTCRNGVWDISACPDCAAPGCPVEPPVQGQACDGCIAPVAQVCSWDLCSSGGAARYSAVCNGRTWDLHAEPCSPNACCQDDSQCGPFICVDTVCKQSAPASCWRDDECGADNICSGATVCPCGADCRYADSPGICVPANVGCCQDDFGCPAAEQCVLGMCRLAPAAGSCWSDRDCANGSTCVGAQICACGAACVLLPDVPGTCN